MLQNKKYVAFAEENTVEVIVVSALDEAIEKQEKRAHTYKAKDVDGTEKEFLLEWPGLTAEDIRNMAGTKAGSYNTTGRIPYTAIVDPHTEEEMGNIRGGYGAGTLMDIVEASRKKLVEAYGKGVSRKTLSKIKESGADIRRALADGNVVKALADALALEKKFAKEGEAVLAMLGKTRDAVLEAAAKQLDEIEAMIDRGETGEAGKRLGPLARALKGTSLEIRATDLLAKTKPE